MAQKNKRIKVIHIHLFLPFIHDGYAVRRERKSEGWDELSNPRESGPNKMAEGKIAQVSEASRSFMQSHSKENGNYVMICNENTGARD